MSFSAFLPFSSSGEDIDVFNTAVFRRLSSGHFLTLRLLPLSGNSTVIDCTLYASNSTFISRKIDGLKREVQLAVNELTSLQNAWTDEGLEFSNCKQLSMVLRLSA